MATIAEIERIAALVEQLLPLRSRRRGELIDADDWNTVVGALLEVARAVVSNTQDGVPTHSHPDQVGPAWLDPTLRARIEKGPLADPASVARVAKVERDLDGLRGSLDGVRTDVTGVRSAADRLEAADLARTSSLTRVVRQVDGLGDARDDVSEVRDTLGTIQADLDRVSGFARDLVVDGQAVSVGELVGRISQLEGLRERLTSPDGTELNATSFALRLAALENTLVTEEELTDALAGHGSPTLPGDLRDQLLADARTAAREQAEATTQGLEDRLTGDIATRLDEVEQSATRAAADRAEELTEQRAAELRDELSSTVTAGDDAVRATLDEALSGLAGSLREELDAQLAEVSGVLETRTDRRLAEATDELKGSVDAALGELRGGLEPLADRVDGAQRDAEKAIAAAGDVDRRLDAVARELGGAIEQGIRTEVDAVRAELLAADKEVTGRLRAELAVERQRVDSEFAAIRGQLPRLVEGALTTVRKELDSSIDLRIDRLREELQRDTGGVVVRPPPRRSDPS